jgi:hypothetical protein
MSQGKEKGVLGFLGDVLMLCLGCVGMLILAVVLSKGASQDTVALLVVVVLVIFVVGVILVTREFIKEHDGWRKLGPSVVWLLVQVPFSLVVVLPVVVPLVKSGEPPEDIWAKGGMAFGASVALRYVVIGLLRGVVGLFRWMGLSGRGVMIHGLFLLLAGMGAWAITAFVQSALLAKGIERSTKVEEKLIGWFLGAWGVLYLLFLFAVRVVKPAVRDTSETLIMDLRVGRGWFFGGMALGVFTAAQFGWKAYRGRKMSALELSLFLLLFLGAMVWASWKQQRQNHFRDWKGILSEKKLMASILMLFFCVVAGRLLWEHGLFQALYREHGLLTATTAGVLTAAMMVFAGGSVAWVMAGLSMPFACVSVATVVFSILYFRAPRMDDLLVLTDLFELMGMRYWLLEWVAIVGLIANGAGELHDVLSLRR